MSELDIKKMIVEEFKAEGIEILEETAMSAAKVAFKILPKIAMATKTKVDDMFIPVVGIIEPKVMEMLDNINKADNA